MGGLPGPGATLIAVTIYAGNYLLIGLGIWLLAIALGMAHEIDYAMATSAFALSWILGFLAPGAPAGLGAREGLMEIGRAHVCTPVTNAHLVCRLLLEKKKYKTHYNIT